ncbi:energy transducer TonB [Arcticibacterium luteifluviistationis]|uniref:Energy transducer TonB n=1 Tax=Arcticibacterium luteifluviistationis TaxID=1784714 RepID=A0A2Z4GHZ7_9BACT|nr:energy transducer TonB [Arcticibacterium luteifluviistationis]AWW00589.1 energy transducer TonB [Arcticibacterium luteifluviistationis]
MDNNKNSSPANLDDIIFEHRNKTYGAYFLRKNYSKFLTKAAVYGISSCLLLIGGAWGYQKFVVPNLAPEEITSVEIDLSALEEELEEEEEIDIPPPEEEEPPPPPPELKQVQFLPPEPKADEEVIIETPPPEDKDLEDAIVSTQDVEGEDVTDVFTPPPPPPPAVTKPAGLGKPKEEQIFTAVEQNPEFPGGTSEMYKYINSKIKYPPAAQRANISGRVFVKFVVEKDGSIGKIDVLKGIGFGCDEEAVRVIKSMPKWNPGRQNGKNVRVFFTMPVFYQLE